MTSFERFAAVVVVPEIGEGDDEDGERCRHQHGEQRARERDPRHERDAYAEGAEHGQTADPAKRAWVRLLDLHVRHRAHRLTRRSRTAAVSS